MAPALDGSNREVGEHQSAVCLERPHVLPRCPHVAVALRNRIHDDDVEAAGAVELGASEDRCPRARRRQPPGAVGAVAAVGAVGTLGRGCRFTLIGRSGAGHAVRHAGAGYRGSEHEHAQGSAEEHPAATPAPSVDQTIHRRVASSWAGRDSATAAHVSAIAAPTAAPTMTGSPAGWAT